MSIEPSTDINDLCLYPDSGKNNFNDKAINKNNSSAAMHCNSYALANSNGEAVKVGDNNQM